MKEIERKWLLKDGVDIQQLIFCAEKTYTISDYYFNPGTRLRIINNEEYQLTIKSMGFQERDELNLVIPKDLIGLFKNKKPCLEKIRYIIPFNNQHFELNIFKNIKIKDRDLIIVELELPCLDTSIDVPDWIGEEVTACPNYYGYKLFELVQNK